MVTKDFASFHDRGVYVDEENDPMSAGLFQLEGASWRTLRAKLTPSFTSGKLKAMFETSDSIGDKLVANIKSQLPQGGNKFNEFSTNHNFKYHGNEKDTVLKEVFLNMFLLYRQNCSLHIYYNMFTEF